MRKNCSYYAFIPLLLLILSLIPVSCGDSNDGYVSPDLNHHSQPEQLQTKEVSGFIYHFSSLASSEDGEEDCDFTVIDVPLSGEEGFIAQLKEYVEENSSKENSISAEDVLNTFIQEAEGYQPLPAWQSGAQLFSVYDDSLSASSIPLNSDGSFAGTASVASTDETVGLEIVLPEGECYEVETISASDLITSGETQFTLKSCPQKITIKPGKCEIFKVFSKPGTNLYEANLTFSLENSGVGCICGPIYLKCNGKKDYSIAYGILYADKNNSTPLDTSIKAETSSGQSINIPVQIVQRKASLSGKVHTGGLPLVKGYVKSLGPKSFCKLDDQGNYVLPEVFMGGGRKVIATWWTQEGNRNVKHREVKYIDLYGDMTGVDFGVVPTPAPRLPSDRFYDDRIAEVILQFSEWEKESGTDQALQKTVSWLNGEMSAPPVPQEIVEARSFDNASIWVYFADGRSMAIDVYYQYEEMAGINTKGEIFNEGSKEVSPDVLAISQDAHTVAPSMLILSPFLWEKEEIADYVANPTSYQIYFGRVHGELREYMEEHLNPPSPTPAVFTIDYKRIEARNIKYLTDMPTPNDPNNYNNTTIPLEYVNAMGTPVPVSITVNDFDTMDDYGVVYINTHGSYPCPANPSLDPIIYCKPVFTDDAELDWSDPNSLISRWGEDLRYNPKYNPDGWWCYRYVKSNRYKDENGGAGWWVKIFYLTGPYFQQLGRDFSNTIFYGSFCYSWYWKDIFNAKIYIGNTWEEPDGPGWDTAHSFFIHLLGLSYAPGGYVFQHPPLDVEEAYNNLVRDGLTIHPFNGNEVKIDGVGRDLYLPGVVELTVFSE